MTDERWGQLCSGWRIPAYAQESLWVEDIHGRCVAAQGDFGRFALDESSPFVILRWGSESGPVLARFDWTEDELGWDGSVRVGGYIDALHIATLPGLDMSIMVAYMGGQPLKPDYAHPLQADSARIVPSAAPDFYTGLLSDMPQHVTTWLVADDSPLASAAHDALMSNLRIYFFGTLTEQDSGWDQYFALPLMLQAVTLFGP